MAVAWVDQQDTSSTSVDTARFLAKAATSALYDELDLTPKPGLVDRASTGAHRDMDYGLMRRAVRALEPGFIAIGQAAIQAVDKVECRTAIGEAGREAERAMMAATGGINTHRGAIWALGLIVAAAARRSSATWHAPDVLIDVAALASIDDPALIQRAPVSNGQRAVARYRVAGARGEAVAGFPAIVAAGLPGLHAARRRGYDETTARLDALVAIMTVLDDTCVLHRAGAEGLAAVQDRARAVIRAGGTATRAGNRALAELDAILISRSASPGGAADLLAATLLIDRLERVVSQSLRTKEIDHANVIA